jgi:hypothetical protein
MSWDPTGIHEYTWQRNASSMKHIVTISYYALEQPTIEVPEALKQNMEIKFVDLMEEDFLVLAHCGVKVYRTYKDQHAGLVEEWSEYWLATERWTDWENDSCFDSRKLPDIPAADRPHYLAIYPDSPLQQSLAHAIDHGLITEDGFDGSDEEDLEQTSSSE